MKRNQNGFSLLEGFLIVLVIVVAGLVGWYIWHSHHETSKQPTVATNTNSNGVFTGTVTTDECAHPTGAAIGDVGCSITVGEKNVYIKHGNINVSSWGNIYGFTVEQDITGKNVEVKAQGSGGNYSISANDDYVKLLD